MNSRKSPLKVYRTTTGFHDAYVAAPSQKAALEAWGTDKNLFARGVAEQVTDPKLTAEPLAAPGTLMGGDDVPGTARGTHVDPFDVETEGLQLGPKHLADFGHTLDVERPAVLVHPFLEHRERPPLLGIDGANHPRFGRR